jgi:PTS system nitrogen regulatory IIA component
VVADVAARNLGLPAPGVLEALLEREAEGSTGVGFGVALPHAVLPGLDRMHAIFVRLETPVAFNAVDDLPVDLMFALLAPSSAGSEHLRALARASRLLRRRDLREQLRAARSADAIMALLSQEVAHTAA